MESWIPNLWWRGTGTSYLHSPHAKSHYHRQIPPVARRPWQRPNTVLGFGLACLLFTYSNFHSQLLLFKKTYICNITSRIHQLFLEILVKTENSAIFAFRSRLHEGVGNKRQSAGSNWIRLRLKSFERSRDARKAIRTSQSAWGLLWSHLPRTIFRICWGQESRYVESPTSHVDNEAARDSSSNGNVN